MYWIDIPLYSCKKIALNLWHIGRNCGSTRLEALSHNFCSESRESEILLFASRFVYVPAFLQKLFALLQFFA